MIFVTDKYYAKVWKVDKHEKYIDLQMTTSEKDRDGNYINSGWFARVIGHAYNSIQNVQAGDRLIVTKSKVSNEKYVDKDGSHKTSLRVVILEAEIEGAAPTPEKAPEKASEDSPW